MNLTTNKACNILSFLNKYKYRNLYYVRWEKNSKGALIDFRLYLIRNIKSMQDIYAFALDVTEIISYRYHNTFKINLRKLNKHKDVISLVPPFRLFNKIKIVIYFLLRRRFWYTPNEIYNNLMEYMIWMDEIQSQIKKIINSHEHKANA